MGFGAEFLTEPSLFPARMAGIQAGTRELTIDVAGGPYRLEGLSEAQFEALGQRYGERCLSGSSDSERTQIHFYAVDSDEFLSFERQGRLNTFDFDYQRHSVRMAGYALMANIAWRPRLVAALWTPSGHDTQFLEAFENCFRTVVAYRLIELGGAVLHSSGVVKTDRAWIFFGHSGAGKTTIARRSLAAGLTVLSDDINAIWLEDGEARVARIPFAGELGHSNERSGPYPLAALTRIEQAEQTQWCPMSPATTVAALLGCSPFINLDPYRLPSLMANLEALAAGTRTGILKSSLDEEFWSVLEAASP